MVGVDTNILVYAHRADSEWHARADETLTALAESDSPWCIAWSCIHEFLAIVTHPRIFRKPTPLKDALIQVECWLESPALRMIGELNDYWRSLKTQLNGGKITGPAVHDARIVAIYLQNGVKQIWSADRDFARFKGIEIVNPLVE